MHEKAGLGPLFISQSALLLIHLGGQLLKESAHESWMRLPGHNGLVRAMLFGLTLHCLLELRGQFRTGLEHCRAARPFVFIAHETLLEGVDETIVAPVSFWEKIALIDLGMERIPKFLNNEESRMKEASEIKKTPCIFKPPFLMIDSRTPGVFDGNSGARLSEEWTGVCVSSDDVNHFWYIGRCENERSFTRLSSASYEMAVRDAQTIASAECVETI